MLGKFLEAGLQVALQIPQFKLGGGKDENIFRLLHDHFYQSSHALGQSFQRSYHKSMMVIAAALAPPTFYKRAWTTFDSRVTKEAYQLVQTRYFTPFCEREGLLEEVDKKTFCKQAIKTYQQAAKRAGEVFPLGQFDEPKLRDMLTNTEDSEELGRILLSSIQNEIKDNTQFKFLAYEGLLLQMVFFFFQEELRREPKVEVMLNTLQQSGLRSDIRDVETARQVSSAAIESQLAEVNDQIGKLQRRLTQETDAMFINMMQQQRDLLQAKQEAYQEELQALSTQLQQAQQQWEMFGQKLDTFRGEFGKWCGMVASQFSELDGKLDTAISILEEEIRGPIVGIGDDVKTLIEQVQAMMNHMGLGSQVSIRHEFTIHTNTNVELIRQAAERLEKTPTSTKEFSHLAIQIGSALSSTGELAWAKKYFDRAYMSAKEHGDDKYLALASYNLFQVELRQGAYEDALKALKESMQLDPANYMLFNAEKYHPLKILGAGGMGCAFLCRDVFLDELVVIKTFWNPKKGSLKEVFNEAFIMRNVDVKGEFIPRPLHIDYANNQTNERPYIIMEYVADAIDGEDFLAKYGALELSEGIGLGVQVARALHKAHQKHIYHLDLKPSNLLLRRDEEGKLHFKIIDFGLARAGVSLRMEAAKQSHSASGMSLFSRNVFGTLDYSPPEQRGMIEYGEPGPKSDIFAFGKTLYRLLSFEPPQQLFPDPLEDNMQLYQLLLRCVRPQPAQRPASAEEVANVLEEILHSLKPDTSGVRISEPLRLLLEQAFDDKLLEETEEDMLWTVARGFGVALDDFQQLIDDWLRDHKARRQVALRIQAWMLTQTPQRFHIHVLWGAVSEAYPKDYTQDGCRRLPWLTPSQILNADPKFLTDDEMHYWFSEWELQTMEQKQKEGEDSSSEFVPFVPESLSVDRFVKYIAIEYGIWVQPRDPETDAPAIPSLTLSECRAKLPQEGEFKPHGVNRVAKVKKSLEKLTGLKLCILDPEGQPAEENARLAQNYITGGKWLSGMGEMVFFWLKPPRKGKDPIWKRNGYLSFGKHFSWLLEGEDAPILIQSSEGHFHAKIYRSKTRFANLSELFEAHPTLEAGDVVCLTHHGNNIFTFDVFPQDGEAGTKLDILDTVAPDLDVDFPPIQEKVVVETVADASSEDELVVEDEDESEDEDEPDDSEDDEEESTEEDLKTVEAAEEIHAEAPDALEGEGAQERMKVSRFVREFAIEHGIWFDIMDPETEVVASPSAFVEDLRVQEPVPMELSFHGRNRIKKVRNRMKKATGLMVQVRSGDGRIASDDEKLAMHRLHGNSFLTLMGESVFFTLKPAIASSNGIPSWRKNGVLSFGSLKERVFPEQEPGPIVVECEHGSFEGALSRKSNRLKGLKKLFASFPELEVGDVVCVTRVDAGIFTLETFLRSTEEDVEELEELVEDDSTTADYEAFESDEEEEAGVGQEAVVVLEKEAGDDSLALLVERAKMYLGEGKIQDALACYEAMHLYHRDVVDEEAELSRRVAAALLYKQGLELLEYAPEQALNKFEASYALDPEFFPKEIMQQMTTLREAKEKQRKVRFIGLCREGQHLSKTDPARALGKFNLAYRLAPQFWTENHTKWVQYLQKLVALQKERAQHDSVRHVEQQS